MSGVAAFFGQSFRRAGRRQTTIREGLSHRNPLESVGWGVSHRHRLRFTTCPLSVPAWTSPPGSDDGQGGFAGPGNEEAAGRDRRRILTRDPLEVLDHRVDGWVVKH